MTETLIKRRDKKKRLHKKVEKRKGKSRENPMALASLEFEKALTAILAVRPESKKITTANRIGRTDREL